MATPYISFDQGRLLLESSPQGYKDIQGNLYTQSYGAQGSGYYLIPTAPVAQPAPIAPTPTTTSGGAILPQNQPPTAPIAPQPIPAPASAPTPTAQPVTQKLAGETIEQTESRLGLSPGTLRNAFISGGANPNYLSNPDFIKNASGLPQGLNIPTTPTASPTLPTSQPTAQSIQSQLDILKQRIATEGITQGTQTLLAPGAYDPTTGKIKTQSSTKPATPVTAPGGISQGTAETANIDFQTQVRDLMKEFGISPASANTNPFSALTDYLNQAYTNLGLTDLKTQIGNTTKQVQTIENELAEKEASINDNPFISEGLRSKQVIKARELSDRKKDALINRLRLDEALYEKGVEQAKFVAQQAMTLTHQQQQTQQDYLFKALDIAIKEAESRRKLNEPQKPTSELQEYNFAVQQGFEGSFLGYKQAVAAAGRKPETLEDLTKLTGTQLNKGAIESGKSIEEFKKLSPEAQRFYSFKDIDSEKKKIDKAIDEGQDPEILRQGIDNSNFPREVKNDLRNYVNKQVGGEQNLPWWRRIF